MICESQERMVAIVEPHRWEAVRAICERWDLPVAVIGRVTEQPDIVVLTGPDGRGALDADGRPVDGARELARIPARALASEAIVFERESRAPDPPPRRPGPGRPRRARRRAADARPGPGRRAHGPARLAEPRARATRCSSSTTPTSRPTASRRPGRGAAVLRIKGTTKALVATTDGNAPVGAAGPVAGRGDVGRRGRAQRRRSPAPGRWASPTASTTATRPAPRPSGSSPRACAASGTRAGRSGLPVTGGNVSLYNEAPGSAIAPTPEIGIVGLLDDVAKLVGPGAPRRRQRGARWSARPARASRAPSTSGSPARRPEDRPPALDLDRERRLQAFIREAIDRGLVESCQDVSGGGLAVAVAEMCIWGGRGARLRLPVGDSPAVALFGESPSRIVCEVLAAARAGVRAARPPARPPGGGAGHDRRRRGWSSSSPAAGAPPAPPRSAGGGIADALDVPVADLRHAWEHGLHAGAGLGRAQGRVPLMCGVVGVVLPGPGHEAAAVAATALFALQHRGQESAGVGVADGGHLMIYKDLGHGGPGARRAADPVAPGRPRRRALPLLHDRLDGLGERPAHAPPRAAPRARHRPQRQPRQHPRAARPARRGPRPPPREHRHGAPDRAPRRRAGRRHRRRAAQGPAAGPRRLQPRDPRRRSGSSACATRSGSGRWSWAGSRSPATATPGLWGDDTGGWILASETAALDIAGARYVRDVEPGEIVVLEPGREPVSVRFAEATPALCVFELIYFARPDSYMEGRNLYEARRHMGMQLAREHPVEADLVMPVPDTGAPGRRGVRGGVGHPVPRGHGPQPVQRPDVHPAQSQAMRQRGVNVKLSPLARGRPRTSG